MLKYEKLSDKLSFGVVVRGITLGDLKSSENRELLRELWFRHGMIVFRENQISHELHIELSKVFGNLEGHFIKDRLVDGHPELVAFASDIVKEPTVNVDGKLFVGRQPWHCDFRWHVQPNHGGILRVHKLPNDGGETGFVSMGDAYDRLDAKTKARIEGLEARYKLMNDDRTYMYFTREHITLKNAGTSYEALRARPDTDFPAVAHPLVRVQPETGRKLLYFSPSNIVEIIGLPPAESEELIKHLAWVVSDPEHAYFHKWKEDDMVLWDNLAMLHQANGVAPGEQREVWRTTISSPHVTGRKLEEGGWYWEEHKVEQGAGAP